MLAGLEAGSEAADWVAVGLEVVDLARVGWEVAGSEAGSEAGWEVGWERAGWEVGWVAAAMAVDKGAWEARH